MKKYCIFAVLLVTSTAYASANKLVGDYACEGKEIATNEAFTCQMTIKQTGKTYFSTATCSDKNSYRGTGIYDARSSTLSTVFINPKKSEETGVCVSEFKADGSLLSTWTYLDKTTLGHTSCRKKS